VPKSSASGVPLQASKQEVKIDIFISLSLSRPYQDSTTTKHQTASKYSEWKHNQQESAASSREKTMK
jgi:hypothetical protein